MMILISNTEELVNLTVLFEQCVHKEHEDIIRYSQTYFYLCMPKAQQVATQQGLMHRISIASSFTSGV